MENKWYNQKFKVITKRNYKINKGVFISEMLLLAKLKYLWTQNEVKFICQWKSIKRWDRQLWYVWENEMLKNEA